ncbi:GNAT family N-acetyltransferase [Providencia manganoxydans]|uniref:GNAT family N-acetyltransferase n=1 Tax=Providencia TaxID=586 RepID=UPI00234A90ED|nr:GNAT family N-acetyltransferase [Providencia sp. PROV266]
MSPSFETYLHPTLSNCSITTNPHNMDITAIHQFLTHSTWAAGISRETVQLSITNSLCFGLFKDDKQIGFARLVTDYATFGYLCDVYIVEEWRNHKLSRWLVECCQQHHVTQRLRRIMLVTSTASWLYEKVGYRPVKQENFVWQIVRPDIYKQ